MEGEETNFPAHKPNEIGEYRRQWGVAPLKNESIFEVKCPIF